MGDAMVSEGGIILPVNYNETPPFVRRIVREEYIKRQGGKCYYCKADLSGNPPESVTKKRINTRLFPVNFFKWPVHLHHDHNTGMTIGAVHSTCNAVLWQYHGE